MLFHCFIHRNPSRTAKYFASQNFWHKTVQVTTWWPLYIPFKLCEWVRRCYDNILELYNYITSKTEIRCQLFQTDSLSNHQLGESRLLCLATQQATYSLPWPFYRHHCICTPLLSSHCLLRHSLLWLVVVSLRYVKGNDSENYIAWTVWC